MKASSYENTQLITKLSEGKFKTNNFQDFVLNCAWVGVLKILVKIHIQSHIWPFHDALMPQ